MQTETEAEIEYVVVINHDEQYSIWPSRKALPDGWKEVGFKGLKELCLHYIKEHWNDMRPLSLRIKMTEYEEKWKQRASPSNPKLSANEKKLSEKISSLVDFLSKGQHPITTMPLYKTIQEFYAAIERNYVHLTFSDTKGPACLGVRLDPHLTQLQQADFLKGQGLARLGGFLILDYVKVRCLAEIHLETLQGTGCLEVIESIHPLSSHPSHAL